MHENEDLSPHTVQRNSTRGKKQKESRKKQQNQLSSSRMHDSVSGDLCWVCVR